MKRIQQVLRPALVLLAMLLVSAPAGLYAQSGCVLTGTAGCAPATDTTRACFEPDSTGIPVGISVNQGFVANFNDALPLPPNTSMPGMPAPIDSIVQVQVLNAPGGLNVQHGGTSPALNTNGVSYRFCFTITGTLQQSIPAGEMVEIEVQSTQQDSFQNVTRRDTLRYRIYSSGSIQNKTILQGKLFVDANNNGQYDSGDQPLQQAVSIGNDVSFADTNGNYTLFADSGAYSLTTSVPKYHQVSVPSGGLPVSDTANGSMDTVTQNIAFEPIAGIQDLWVKMNPVVQFQNGFKAYVDVSYKNQGTAPVNNAALKLHWPAQSIDLDTAYAQSNGWTLGSGDTVTYSLSQPLPAGASGSEKLAFNVPVDTSLLGDTLQLVASIEPSAGDTTAADNHDTLQTPIVGSWDPNDKRLMNHLAGQPEKIYVNERTHDYMIRFQNTGTAPAVNVELRDTLNSRFEASTFQMTSASHAYTLQMQEAEASGRTVLVWRFNNIMLPDSNTNEPESHGYVRFTIEREAGLTIGDSVPNRAGIYFDFNPVVLTNTVSGEVADKTVARAERQAQPGELSVAVYPNPTAGSFRVRGDFSAQAPATVRVRDLQGRLLLQRRVTQPNERLTPALSRGLYLVDVQQGSRRAVRKLMVR
jgi:hypothetical protein